MTPIGAAMTFFIVLCLGGAAQSAWSHTNAGVPPLLIGTLGIWATLWINWIIT